ncbi:MAG: alpha/beta hydrolase [Burkholderiales bacterium]
MTVPLDPQALAVLDFLRGLALPATAATDIKTARANYLRTRRLLAPPPPAVALVEDLTIAGPGGPLALRHYRGDHVAADVPAPGLLFFHGGGWNTGDLDTHDALCRQLANALRGVVVAVGYRLAPEHPFPAAFDDAVAALDWFAANAEQLHVAQDKLVVGGDSAGGNLAAALAIAARDKGGPPLAAQVLIYPATDAGMAHSSFAEFGTGYMLEAQQMAWNWTTYAPPADRATDWRVSPLAVRDFSRLPAAIVITAGYDPLRDEGEAFAERLFEAGIPVMSECFEGMIHGFVPMGGRIAAANHAIVRIAQTLRQTLGLAKAPGVSRR